MNFRMKGKRIGKSTDETVADDDHQLEFMSIIEKFPVVLQKSQIPHMKQKKEQALEQILGELGGHDITVAQIRKKLTT